MTADIVLSVIIPIFNEEKSLDKSAGEINSYFIENGNFAEIIIVNDGSTDSSLELIENKILKNQRIRIIDNEKRKGKALSVKEGVMAASGKFIIFIDADMSVPLKEINKILPYLNEGRDIVVGIRDELDADTVVIRPLIRKIISKLYNMFCHILFFENKIKDMGCGFKAFKREVALVLFADLSIKSWVFDAEVMIKALRSGYAIEQVPVNWTFKGHSHMNIYKDLIAAFFELLKLKLFNKSYKIR